MDFISSLEKKRAAEDARYRGNEYMKAKEYEEAINAYSRSINMNPNEAATYCNRAMAHLRMKNYARAIDDANKTIEMEGPTKDEVDLEQVFLGEKSFTFPSDQLGRLHDHTGMHRLRTCG